jgi:hypothetical protein
MKAFGFWTLSASKVYQIFLRLKNEGGEKKRERCSCGPSTVHEEIHCRDSQKILCGSGEVTCLEIKSPFVHTGPIHLQSRIIFGSTPLSLIPEYERFPSN